MEKTYGSFMVNGMNHSTSEIRKQKRKENYGDLPQDMNFGHIHTVYHYLVFNLTILMKSSLNIYLQLIPDSELIKEL